MHTMNTLYFGDNLDVLKRLNQEHSQGCIDLIYIDPPFNSKRNYNILFEDADLEDTKAQKEAFADTWSTISYLDTLEEIKTVNLGLYYVLHAFDQSSVSKSALSYLATMAIRIWYMHKVLKDTGSFYLHCDSTMSHYLKIVCDLIFGDTAFRNEIIWFYRRWSAFAHRFQRSHDSILFYTKHDKNIHTFNLQLIPYTAKTNKRWKGERMHNIVTEHGKLLKEPAPEHEEKGANMPDVWEISILNSQAKERLGYPTQKPEELL